MLPRARINSEQGSQELCLRRPVPPGHGKASREWWLAVGRPDRPFVDELARVIGGRK